MTTVAGERASAGARSVEHGLDQGEITARLREVAGFEASVKLTPIGKLLRVVGRTPAFATVYRRVGPPLDLWLGRRFKGQVAGRMYR
ncbi:MAG: hypothetical protein V9F82_00005, partial [Dermatophilaceae bacterium]